MSSPLKFRVLLTGGGTGGHIYPLVCVAEKLKEYTDEKGFELDMRYFGSPGPYGIYLENAGIPVTQIASSKMRRYFSMENFLDGFKFVFGILQSLWRIFWFMPDVVFTKGGPGALAVILACQWYRIPIVVHESDAVAGLTNKHTGKHAEIIEVAFAEAKDDFSGEAPVHIVGVPVRNTLFIKESPATSRISFSLSDQKPIVLILGGSQGATTINLFVLENSEALLSEFEIIHPVGRENYLKYKAEYEFMSKNHPAEIKANYVYVPYLNDTQMAAALNAADIVVSRAGSGIFEIAATGKPSILIPLPTSANDHQRENAYAYAKTGAAIVIEEENLLPGLLITQIKKILGNPAQLERMKAAAKKFYMPSAADDIANDLIEASHISSYYGR